jgi:hypothetical protein
MPLQEHPEHANSSTEPNNDVAWMNAVLSPSAADVPSLPAPPFSPADGPPLAIDPDLPPSSFRLQFLRAWTAAISDRSAKVAGHA